MLFKRLNQRLRGQLNSEPWTSMSPQITLFHNYAVMSILHVHWTRVIALFVKE